MKAARVILWVGFRGSRSGGKDSQKKNPNHICISLKRGKKKRGGGREMKSAFKAKPFSFTQDPLPAKTGPQKHGDALLSIHMDNTIHFRRVTP